MQPMSASLSRRALARLIDAFLIEFLMTAAISYAVTEAAGSPELSGGTVLAAGATIVVLRLAYYAGLEALQGATLGKRMLNLQVRGFSGSAPPTLDQAVLRNAWVLLAFVPGWPGWVLWVGAALSIAGTIRTDDRRRGWHDRLAGGARVVMMS